MSEQAGTVPVPQWDTADRLRKALRESGTGVQEMADYLGVSRTSASNWINGRIEPDRRTLRLWALRSGVSYEWLCHGDHAPCGPGVSAGQGGFVVRDQFSCSFLDIMPLRVAA
jgi:transcriptional regulator with XRE-family HTH domain